MEFQYHFMACLDVGRETEIVNRREGMMSENTQFRIGESRWEIEKNVIHSSAEEEDFKIAYCLNYLPTLDI